MTELLQFDQDLFYLINNEWQNAFLDGVMPYWRYKLIWFPLYLFIISFSLINFKIKGLYFILALVLSIGVADIISSHLIKKSVKRERPCKQSELKEEVHLLVRCGSGYSFPSSHAANHFAIAGFLLMTLARKKWWLRASLLLWAGSISYGQVYVGVHYPLDVICGGMLGYIIGWSISILYRQLVGVRVEEFYLTSKS